MDLVAVAPRLPHAGETLEGQRFYTAPGGKGANQAVAAARMGCRVKLFGRVGQDTFGSQLLQGLEASGVDVGGVHPNPDTSSGIAMILLDQAGQNHIVAVYGANLTCDETQLRGVEESLEGAAVLLLQQEIPLSVSLEAARMARARGVTVILDPAPARELPADAFGLVDIITPNQGEASFLTGTAVTDPSSARVAAEKLVRLGVETPIVTLGELGVYYLTQGGGQYIPALTVQAVDTVAAGDAFNGALAAGLALGRGLPDAVRWGMAAGAICVTRPGAQEAMPTREEVEELLSTG